jgi:hypothetical protein
MILSFVVLVPFVVLRRPWAVRLWRRVKLILVIYVIVIAVAGIVRLVIGWDDIYG